MDECKAATTLGYNDEGEIESLYKWNLSTEPLNDDALDFLKLLN